MTTSPSGDGRTPSLLQRRGLRQFIKFCIVGASSTVISASIFFGLIKILHLDQVVYGWLSGWPRVQHFVAHYDLHIQLAALVSFVFGVTNGFIWNSRWTFQQTDPTLRRLRFVKFVLVNIVGLTLNQIILFVVYQTLTAGKPEANKDLETLISFLVATGTVVFWNFFANKHWTFKVHGIPIEVADDYATPA